MSAQKYLYLIDGSALAYRSHFAFIRSPLVTRNGQIVSAIYGFTQAVLRILESVTPSHFAVVFDARGKTFRHERYAEYKATRQKMPEELVEQLPDIDEVLAALNVPCMRVTGCEADDVIGTLARLGSEAGMAVRIVSGDKDFGQLVDEQVQIYAPGRGDDPGETQGPEGVREKMGVLPHQVIDYLALMGDASDNVPGVPKVGKKTAQQLIEQFGSMDALYARLDEVRRTALRKTLEDNRELAELSRELVTILTDVALPLSLEELTRREPDADRLRRLFHQYGFTSLMTFLPESVESSAPGIETHYRCAGTAAELTELGDELSRVDRVSLYTLCSSDDPMRARLLGIAFAFGPGQAVFIPVRGEDSPLFASESGHSLEAIRKAVGPGIARESLRKVGHDLKATAHVLRRHGLPMAGPDFDVELAHYCISPAASHSLEAMALDALNATRTPLHDLLGKGRNQIAMDDVALERQTPFACEAADLAGRLEEPLQAEMEHKEVATLYQELERPLIEVLGRMEAAGVKLDVPTLNRLSVDLEERCGNLEKEIHVLAGEPFNVNSPKQLAEVLYEKLEVHKEVGVKRVPKTKTGFSTAAAALAPMEGHPLVSKVLEYRQLEKLRSTYVDSLPAMVNPDTGLLHTRYRQAVAATGRLSSADPNLQNIPIRTQNGRQIRKAFRSSFEDGRLVSADYSQVELRIMAHLSGDTNLCAAFARGEDVHRHTASLIFEVEAEKVDSAMRTRAKAINFGILYGMGANRLARETGLSNKEAQAFIKTYFEVFSGVKAYLDATLELAREQGYVTTLLGRRRWIPELHSGDGRLRANAENMAVNTPIQGSAADLIKKAMIAMDRELRERELRSRMILQVHDELVFDVPGEEAQTVLELARHCMESAHSLNVPLTVDAGVGVDWLEAH